MICLVSSLFRQVYTLPRHNLDMLYPLHAADPTLTRCTHQQLLLIYSEP